MPPDSPPQSPLLQQWWDGVHQVHRQCWVPSPEDSWFEWVSSIQYQQDPEHLFCEEGSLEGSPDSFRIGYFQNEIADSEKLSDMSLKKLEGDLRNSSRKRHRISSKIETERIIKSRSDFEYQIRQSERDFRRLDWSLKIKYRILVILEREGWGRSSFTAWSFES